MCPSKLCAPAYADKHLGELTEAEAHQRSRAGQSAIPLLRLALEKEADGSGAQLPGPEAVRKFHTMSARCENVSCCTSVAAVQPPIIRQTGGLLRKRMTTIYVDLLTDRGRYLYWVDAALGTRRCVHGLPAGRLDQLQLRYCHV